MAALEQRSAIKFCVANKKSRQETFEMLKTAYGNNAMKKTALYKWYSKRGDNSVTDEPRPNRPSSISTKKIETVKGLLDSDRQMTIRDITIRTGIPSVRCLELFIIALGYEENLCEMDTVI